MEILVKNGSLVTKTKKEKKKKSCPGVKLTLVEREPGVAVLLLVNLV